MEGGPAHMTIWDYVIFGLTMMVCAGIGVVTGRKKKGAPEDTVVNYLLANRRMAVIPVSFSIMATIMSAISMAGGIGEMYLYGAQFQFSTLAGALGKVAVAIFIVPVFHQMEYVSVYEYLELRYDRSMRLLFSIIYLAGNAFYLGVVLYIPALSLTTVTGIPYIVTSTVTGAVCVFYCVLGGYAAVIWTDVLQTLLMFTCFGLIMVIGIWDAGGLLQTAIDNYDGGRLHFDLQENEDTRYSVWALCISGFLLSAKNYSTNQAGVQRLLSVKNTKAAQKSVYISTGLMLFYKVLLIFSGFAIYSKFKDCDPLSDPRTGVKSSDQILVYAIGVMLRDIPGLAGLALSGIISGSLSTFSSYINAFAALTLEDYLKPFFPNLTKTEKRNIFICKVLTAFYGIMAILISFGIPYLGGAIKTYSSVVAASSGPLCGVMMLGMFAPRTNAKVCKMAMLITIAFMTWLAVGSQMNPLKSNHLPTSTEGCPAFNETHFFNGTLIVGSPVYDQYYATPSTNLNQTDLHPNKDIFPLFKISFMWFGAIGVGMTLVLGMLFSLVWGNKEFPDPRLLNQLVVPKHMRIKAGEEKTPQEPEEKVKTISEEVSNGFENGAIRLKSLPIKI